MRLTSDSVLDELPAGTSGVMDHYRHIVRRRLLLLLCDQERAVVQGRAYLFAKRLKDAGKLI